MTNYSLSYFYFIYFHLLTQIQLNLDKPRTVWVITLEVEVACRSRKRNIAIVINAETFAQATDIDYFITNADTSIVTPEWIVNTYSTEKLAVSKFSLI